MPGPPPTHPARRRRRNVKALLALPAEGYRGRIPRWPMAEQSDAEARLWRELWRTPQAAAWISLSVGREVAQYVRWKIRAEENSVGGAKAALNASKEARLLADRLGLTPLALKRLEWEITGDEVAEKREESAQPSPARRLRAVDPALGA